MQESVFDDVLGHDDVKRVLMAALEHPAPGYVLVGPEGVGKRLLAERFIHALLDFNYALPVSAHPDASVLERAEGARGPSIEQTRALIQRMHLSAARGGRKVALIPDAETLNDSSTSALLKSVEEAPAQAVFIFLTHQAEHLPATLRSRLVTLVLSPVAATVLRDWLVRQGVSASKVELAVRFAHGCPGRALRFARDDEAEAAERARQADWRAFFSASLGERCQLLEDWHGRAESAEDAAQVWRERLHSGMRACEEAWLNQPRDAMRAALGIALAWQALGSSLSPRLMLEWSLVRQHVDESLVPPALSTQYLSA